MGWGCGTQAVDVRRRACRESGTRAMGSGLRACLEGGARAARKRANLQGCRVSLTAFAC